MYLLKTSSRVCSQCLLRWFEKRVYSTQSYYKLTEVGKLESPQTTGCYPAGQFFLHRVFGYRGVILFPWTTCVYDRDVEGSDGSRNTWEEDGLLYNHIKGLKPETKSYYQALIDHKDFPYIRTHPEAITFLASSADSSLYSLPGLDYVSHEDVLPYTNSGQEPFTHELFSQFFVSSIEKEGPLIAPRDLLKAWREKNDRWLSLGEVHRETTNGVRVTVMPFYMGRRNEAQAPVYWWRYNIRLECLNGERLVLRERHWRIYSVSGTLETVKGRGVIGQEPVFSPAQPAFQYSSHVSLQSPSGHMWGTFLLERPDRSSFEVRVPPFSLESQDER